MGERKKFNFGSAGLGIRETNKNAPVMETKVQQLVETIENASVNTAFHFKSIPREKLAFHKKNNYPMEAIEKLAESILNVGLIHNIDVSYDEEADLYVIDAGEQRTRAIDYLLEKYRNYDGDKDSEEYQRYLIYVKPFEKGYPCKVSMGSSHIRRSKNLDSVQIKELDAIDAEMRLYISNEIGRGHDPARTKEAVANLARLEERRRELLENSGRTNINKKIGEQLNITERQVQKYKAIGRLIPELQELFREKGITLTDGANYAKLNEDEQRQILAFIQAGEDKREVHSLYEQLNRMQTEIAAKERSIKKLEEEKGKAILKAAEEKEAAAVLEQKIREEAKENAQKENRQKTEFLEKQLEKAKQKMSHFEKQISGLEEEKQREIKALEKQLEEKEKQKTAGYSDTVRKALQIEQMLALMETSVRQLFQVIQEYRDVYQPDSGEKSPEEFEGQLRKIFDRD